MFNAKIALLGAAAALSLLAVPAHAQTISNNPTGGSISSFGIAESPTYGQVFTAPITGTLTSFTLWLNGGVGALAGGVGTWNGTSTYGEGFGSPVNLFESAATPALAAGAYTFNTDIAVTAGSLYVAYLTTFGVAGTAGSTSMPLGDDANPNINYFVWLNGGDPQSTGSWNYFNNFGDAQFSATFSPAAVPEPATWAMMIGGFALAGAAMRRRSSKVSFA